MSRNNPPNPFQIELDDRQSVVVVRVKGEVDTVTAPRMGAALDDHLSQGRRVVLDLADVEFMDLHGLAVLMRASRQARSDGGDFAVARPAWCVRRLVELVHADAEVPILRDGSEPLDAA